MPSFFNDGNTPARSDGMWKIEQKILGALNELIAIGSGGTSTGGGTMSGNGSPEGVVAAPVGSVYTDLDAPYHQWNKITGSGNTGWVQFI